MTTIITELDQLNERLETLFSQLREDTGTEGNSLEPPLFDSLEPPLFENLESGTRGPLFEQLTQLISRRQSLLQEMVHQRVVRDPDYLSLQLRLTKAFTQYSIEIKAQRKALLDKGRKNKKKINTYNAIELTR